MKKRTLIDALNQPTQKQHTKRLFCFDLEESEYEKLIKKIIS